MCDKQTDVLPFKVLQTVTTFGHNNIFGHKGLGHLFAYNLWWHNGNIICFHPNCIPQVLDRLGDKTRKCYSSAVLGTLGHADLCVQLT